MGQWRHPATGQLLNFTLPRLIRMAQASNKWLALGNKIWFSSGDKSHNADSRNVLGFWDRFKVENGVLFGEVEVRDRATIEQDKVGRTIVDVSPGIGLDVTASTGDHFEEVLLHVAATPQPVIPGQGNFIKLAREEDTMEKKQRLIKLLERAGLKDIPEVLLDAFSRGVVLQDDTEEKVDEAVAGGAPPEEAVANVFQEEEEQLQSGPITPEELKALLGLPPEAQEGDIIETVRAMLTPQANVEPAPAPATGVPLSRRVDALEKELQLSREETARARIQSVHEVCARAGTPMEKDTEQLILSAFKDGRKDDAEGMLKLARESAEKIAAARKGATAVPLSSESQKRHDEEKLAERKAFADSLKAAGYMIECDAEYNITKKVAPGAD